MEGLHDAAQEPRRHLVRRLRRLPDPGRGQDRDRRSARPRRPVLVRGPRPVSRPAYRDDVTIEEGGFGAESAAPAALQILEAYFDKQASSVSHRAHGGAE